MLRCGVHRDAARGISNLDSSTVVDYPGILPGRWKMGFSLIVLAFVALLVVVLVSRVLMVGDSRATGLALDDTCPICSRELKKPRKCKALYGVKVCNKCRNGFANRRQAASGLHSPQPAGRRFA